MLSSTDIEYRKQVCAFAKLFMDLSNLGALILLRLLCQNVLPYHVENAQVTVSLYTFESQISGKHA